MQTQTDITITETVLGWEVRRAGTLIALTLTMASAWHMAKVLA